MNYNIIATPRFKRELKRLSKKYNSIKLEYAELLDNLENNPAMGISIGGNCYKIRLSIASKRKGKSGGARIITYVYKEAGFVYLLSIYDKSEQENISDKELQNLLKEIK